MFFFRNLLLSLRVLSRNPSPGEHPTWVTGVLVKPNDSETPTGINPRCGLIYTRSWHVNLNLVAASRVLERYYLVTSVLIVGHPVAEPTIGPPLLAPWAPCGVNPTMSDHDAKAAFPLPKALVRRDAFVSILYCALIQETFI